MKIAMIMLAAGNSRRFGANKLLYEIDGIPMYRHVLEQLDDTKKKIENIYSEYSDITEDNNNDNNSDIVQLNNLYRNNITAKIICNIIVITQYDAIAEAVKTKEIQVLYNPHPEDGISSSVKIGLNASLDADMLIILTAVEKVAVNFGKENEEWLDDITVDDAKKYINEGQFAPGSMLPKVQAAVDFASSKEGRTAMITLLQKAKDGIQGKTGTKIHL